MIAEHTRCEGHDAAYWKQMRDISNQQMQTQMQRAEQAEADKRKIQAEALREAACVVVDVLCAERGCTALSVAKTRECLRQLADRIEAGKESGK
jgi:hypothetical protein